MSVFNWVDNVVHTAGRTIHSMTHAVSSATGKVLSIFPHSASKTAQGDAALNLIPSLEQEGREEAVINPVIQCGSTIVMHGEHGYFTGIGLSKRQIDAAAVTAIRTHFTGDDLKGFDTALSLHIGMVTTKAPPGLDCDQQAAWYVVMGMRGAGSGMKKGMMAAVLQNPKRHKGVQVAVDTATLAKSSLWTRIKAYLGIKPKPVNLAATPGKSSAPKAV